MFYFFSPEKSTKNDTHTFACSFGWSVQSIELEFTLTTLCRKFFSANAITAKILLHFVSCGNCKRMMILMCAMRLLPPSNLRCFRSDIFGWLFLFVPCEHGENQ